MKLKIDQIAIYVGDREKAKGDFKETFGLSGWVTDEVHCVNEKDEGFDYSLAFNYELIEKGVEFEIIQGVDGKSYHNDLKAPCISHFGMHVENLEKAVEHFKNKGFEVLQENKTIEHTGTDNRYNYTFMDTRGLLGCPLKLIRRQ